MKALGIRALVGAACCGLMALCACAPERDVDAEIARELGRGDYEAARQTAAAYLPADLDLIRGARRFGYITEVESHWYLPRLIVEGSRWERQGSEALVRVVVRNTGSKAIRYCEVTVCLLDAAGTTLDTTLGLFSQLIAPGSRRELELPRRWTDGIRTVRASVTDIRVVE